MEREMKAKEKINRLCVVNVMQEDKVDDSVKIESGDWKEKKCCTKLK